MALPTVAIVLPSGEYATDDISYPEAVLACLNVALCLPVLRIPQLNCIIGQVHGSDRLSIGCVHDGRKGAVRVFGMKSF